MKPIPVQNNDILLNYIIISRDDRVEKKCTLYPLRDRPDFSFRTRKNTGKLKPDYILLFPHGEPLTKELGENIVEGVKKGKAKDRILTIVLIDARWKKAQCVMDSLPGMKCVSLVGFVTGAKRKEPPPEGGLASVEALYLASLAFKRPDPTLLDHYHFRKRFLMLNNLENDERTT